MRIHRPRLSARCSRSRTKWTSRTPAVPLPRPDLQCQSWSCLVSVLTVTSSDFFDFADPGTSSPAHHPGRASVSRVSHGILDGTPPQTLMQSPLARNRPRFRLQLLLMPVSSSLSPARHPAEPFSLCSDLLSHVMHALTLNTHRCTYPYFCDLMLPVPFRAIRRSEGRRLDSMRSLSQGSRSLQAAKGRESQMDRSLSQRGSRRAIRRCEHNSRGGICLVAMLDARTPSLLTTIVVPRCQ